MISLNPLETFFIQALRWTNSSRLWKDALIVSNSNFLILYFIAALLALAGGAFSIYFQLVYTKKINSRQLWVPQICQLDSNMCTAIVDTRYGRLAKFTNSLYGSIFFPGYAIVLLMSGFQLIPTIIPMIIGLITFVISSYLIYGLIQLRTYCPLCITVHIIVFLILLNQFIATSIQ